LVRLLSSSGENSWARVVSISAVAEKPDGATLSERSMICDGVSSTQVGVLSNGTLKLSTLREPAILNFPVMKQLAQSMVRRGGLNFILACI
jgi:hypothetical protein